MQSVGLPGVETGTPVSKIADANYMLRATAEEGDAFQVLGV